MSIPNRQVHRRLAPLVRPGLVIGSLAVILTVHGAVAQTATRSAGYIIQLRSGLRSQAAQGVVRRTGSRPRHVYVRAIEGFAADLTPAQVRMLRRDPRVWRIVRDLPVRVPRQADDISSAPAPSPMGRRTRAQAIPTGIARCGVENSPTADLDGVDTPMPVDVAVLDTGIDSRHPDLRVAGGYSVFRGGKHADVHGHGTHVAGIIGALDNRQGVVGMAPGVRLWSVRVLPRSGRGKWSDVIKGLDWVAANAGTIDVANLSLGGEIDDPGPLRSAITSCVRAGVTMVVAAGNDRQDIAGAPPYTYPIYPAMLDGVITVSAMADRDGTAGYDPALFRIRRNYFEDDESFADFSNYGARIDLIAPGVNIRSTFKGKKYATFSGTSQASPHVAGAAALYLATHANATPQEVRNALVARGADFSPSDDPDGIHEPLLNVFGL